MSDKPKFGIDADAAQASKASTERPTFGTDAVQSSTETSKSDFVDSKANAGDTKPQFGTNAQTEKVDRPTFGTSSAASQSDDSKKSLGHWIMNSFKMQPVSFWLKQYAFAVLGFWFTIGMYESALFFLGIVNLILYPFTVTILQEIGRNREDKGTLSSFFFGFSVGMIGSSIWWIVIYGIIRLFIFILKFTFSFLIGTIGLIYIISQAKKLNR